MKTLEERVQALEAKVFEPEVLANHGPIAEVSKVRVGRKTLYGVDQGGALVYDPIFNKAVATRLAELENSTKPDWEHARQILLAEGFKEKDL